jgi:hypothetical protein
MEVLFTYMQFSVFPLYLVQIFFSAACPLASQFCVLSMREMTFHTNTKQKVKAYFGTFRLTFKLYIGEGKKFLIGISYGKSDNL